MSNENDLSAIVDLTVQMLDMARRGEWDDLAIKEEWRRAQLEKFFVAPVDKIRQRQVVGQIERILELNRELTLLAEQEKDAVAAKLGDLKQNRRAADAYRSLS